MKKEATKSKFIKFNWVWRYMFLNKSQLKKIVKLNERKNEGLFK